MVAETRIGEGLATIQWGWLDCGWWMGISASL